MKIILSRKTGLLQNEWNKRFFQGFSGSSFLGWAALNSISGSLGIAAPWQVSEVNIDETQYYATTSPPRRRDSDQELTFKPGAIHNDSWSIRWHASIFLRNELTLPLASSMIYTIGLEGSRTHSENSLKFDSSDRPTKTEEIDELREAINPSSERRSLTRASVGYTCSGEDYNKAFCVNIVSFQEVPE